MHTQHILVSNLCMCLWEVEGKIYNQIKIVGNEIFNNFITSIYLPVL